MSTRIVFTYLVSALLGLVVTIGEARASAITWDSPQTIAGSTDVSTEGTYFGSWAPGNVDANTTPVNGVTFQGSGDLPGLGFTDFVDTFGGYGGTTGNANYDSLITWGIYGNTGGAFPATVFWGGLTPGQQYLIQLWVNDARNLNPGDPYTRTATVTGVSSDTSSPLSYPGDGTGNGQYVIGRFSADSSSITLTLSPSSSNGGINASAQLNLLQVRTVPEPSTIALLGLGGAGMIYAALRRKV